MPRRRNRTDETFQMAPMIDMVFLLLVFFMTVSTLAKDARPELELAVSTTAAVPEATPPRDIVTIKQEDGSVAYFWSNRRVKFEELSGLLQKRDASGQNELLLRAGPGLRWSIWDEVIRLLRETAVTDVIIATFED